MTIIYLNDRNSVLCLPSSDEQTAAESAIWTQENGLADQLEITIYENNAQYDTVALNQKVLIDIDGINAFCGFVVNIERSIFGSKKITAISAETLLDRVIIPFYTSGSEIDAVTYFTNFETFVDESLPSTLDFVATFVAPDDKLAPMENGWESALTVLRKVQENNNLNIFCREVAGMPTIYISIASPSVVGGITFGANMLDYTDNFSLDDIITSAIPIGAQVGTYSDGSPKYLLFGNHQESIAYPFVASDMHFARIDNPDLPDLITNYGRKTVVLKFDTITHGILLGKRALQWLAANSFAKLKMNVTGLDINALTGQDYNPSTYSVGNLVHISCPPLSVETDLMLQKQTIDLLHPEKSVLNLSGSRELSYTQQVQKQFGG